MPSISAPLRSKAVSQRLQAWILPSGGGGTAKKQYAKPGVEIRNAIQTNGYTIDEEWAAFSEKIIFWWDCR